MAKEKPGQDKQIHDQVKDQIESRQFFGSDSGIGESSKIEAPGLMQRRLFERVTKRDLAIFARQLSLLLDLGLTLLRALNIVAKRTGNQRMVKIIKYLGEKVEIGEPLSVAMSNYREDFGEFFLVAVRAGEETGEIGKTLNDLADYLEKEDEFRGKFQKALSFPLLTLAMAALVVGFLMIYVIPTFANIYQEVGVELPMITQVVIGISVLIKSFWWLILLAIVAIVAMFYKSGRMLKIGWFIDRFNLRMPIIGTITMKMAVFRFARITSTMLDSGVSILSTLRIAATATNNKVISSAVLKATGEIDKGSTVEQALRKYNAFPPFVTDMIGVGEEAGSLGKVLKKIADYYQRDVDDLMTNLATIIEPIMTLMMGIIVVFIALSMFLPYFNISKVIMGG